jgi:hypothetical protein
MKQRRSALQNDLPSSGRALVPLTAVESKPHVSRIETRPAVFLAHLLASAKQVPQARQRSRGEPAEAIAAYRSAMARFANH